MNAWQSKGDIGGSAVSFSGGTREELGSGSLIMDWQSHRNKKWLRTIAVLLVVTFVNQDLIWAQGGTPVWAKAQNGSFSVKTPVNVTGNIAIPKDVAVTKEVYHAPGSSKTIINIQDAHASLAAQESISCILDSLVTNYDLRLVAIEGSSGYIDTSILKTFPDEKVRKDTAKYLMAKGRMSAGEFFSITSDKPIALYGIEDKPLYKENVEQFKEVYEINEATKGDIEGLLSTIKTLQARIYSKDLRELDANSVLHKDGKIGFSDRWELVSKLAVKMGLDYKKYQNLSKLVESLKLEKGISFEKANKERDALIDILSKTLPKQELEQLVLRSLSFKTGKISQGEFYLFLQDLARKYGIDPEPYKNLITYTEYITLYESIDLLEIFEEVKLFEDTIKEKLFANDDQRKLHDISKCLGYVKDLFELKLANGDFEYLAGHIEICNAQAIAAFIREVSVKYNIPLEGNYDIGRIFENIPKALEFYRTAEKRNVVMFSNTIKRMTEEKQEVAALVTGGYHTKGLSEILRQKETSYLVILPKFDASKGERPYVAILTNKKEPYEGLLKSGQYYLATGAYFEGAISDAKFFDVATTAISQMMTHAESAEEAAKKFDAMRKRLTSAQKNELRSVTAMWVAGYKDYYEKGEWKKVKDFEPMAPEKFEKLLNDLVLNMGIELAVTAPGEERIKAIEERVSKLETTLKVSANRTAGEIDDIAKSIIEGMSPDMGEKDIDRELDRVARRKKLSNADKIAVREVVAAKLKVQIEKAAAQIAVQSAPVPAVIAVQPVSPAKDRLSASGEAVAATPAIAHESLAAMRDDLKGLIKFDNGNLVGLENADIARWVSVLPRLAEDAKAEDAELSYAAARAILFALGESYRFMGPEPITENGVIGSDKFILGVIHVVNTHLDEIDNMLKQGDYAGARNYCATANSNIMLIVDRIRRDDRISEFSELYKFYNPAVNAIEEHLTKLEKAPPYKWFRSLTPKEQGILYSDYAWPELVSAVEKQRLSLWTDDDLGAVMAIFSPLSAYLKDAESDDEIQLKMAADFLKRIEEKRSRATNEPPEYGVGGFIRTELSVAVLSGAAIVALFYCFPAVMFGILAKLSAGSAVLAFSAGILLIIQRIRLGVIQSRSWSNAREKKIKEFNKFILGTLLIGLLLLTPYLAISHYQHREPAAAKIAVTAKEANTARRIDEMAGIVKSLYPDAKGAEFRDRVAILYLTASHETLDFSANRQIVETKDGSLLASGPAVGPGVELDTAIDVVRYVMTRPDERRDELVRVLDSTLNGKWSGISDLWAKKRENNLRQKLSHYLAVNPKFAYTVMAIRYMYGDASGTMNVEVRNVVPIGELVESGDIDSDNKPASIIQRINLGSTPPEFSPEFNSDGTVKSRSLISQAGYWRDNYQRGPDSGRESGMADFLTSARKLPKAGYDMLLAQSPEKVKPVVSVKSAAKGRAEVPAEASKGAGIASGNYTLDDISEKSKDALVVENTIGVGNSLSTNQIQAGQCVAVIIPTNDPQAKFILAHIMPPRDGETIDSKTIPQVRNLISLMKNKGLDPAKTHALAVYVNMQGGSHSFAGEVLSLLKREGIAVKNVAANDKMSVSIDAKGDTVNIFEGAAVFDLVPMSKYKLSSDNTFVKAEPNMTSVIFFGAIALIVAAIVALKQTPKKTRTGNRRGAFLLEALSTTGAISVLAVATAPLWIHSITAILAVAVPVVAGAGLYARFAQPQEVKPLEEITSQKALAPPAISTKELSNRTNYLISIGITPKPYLLRYRTETLMRKVALLKQYGLPINATNIRSSRKRIDEKIGRTDIEKELLAAAGFSDYRIGQVLAMRRLKAGIFTELRTGGGKTLTIAGAALSRYKEKGERALIMTHEDALTSQAMEKDRMGEVLSKSGAVTGFILPDSEGRERGVIFENGVRRDATVEEVFDKCAIVYGKWDRFVHRHLKEMLGIDQKAMNNNKYFSLTDEADLMLVFGSATPCIISGDDMADHKERISARKAIDDVVRNTFLTGKDLYYIPKGSKEVFLTDKGQRALRAALNELTKEHTELADILKANMESFAIDALKAHLFYKPDEQYYFDGDKVYVRDEHTGAKKVGMSFGEGLQQAIEIMAVALVTPEKYTLASMTIGQFENDRDLIIDYAGASGTMEKDRFEGMYEGKKVETMEGEARKLDKKGRTVFNTKEEKRQALVEELRTSFGSGQPILIKVDSDSDIEELRKYIESNLGEELKRHGMIINEANGSDAEAFARAISIAGYGNVVTITTNIAHRGIDITVMGRYLNKDGSEGEEVPPIGKLAPGLFVISEYLDEAEAFEIQTQGRADRGANKGSWKGLSSLDERAFTEHAKLLNQQLAGLKAAIKRGDKGIVEQLISEVRERITSEKNRSDEKRRQYEGEVFAYQQKVFNLLQLTSSMDVFVGYLKSIGAYDGIKANVKGEKALAEKIDSLRLLIQRKLTEELSKFQTEQQVTRKRLEYLSSLSQIGLKGALVQFDKELATAAFLARNFGNKIDDIKGFIKVVVASAIGDKIENVRELKKRSPRDLISESFVKTAVSI
ncbi:MAG: hypothetical protein Q7S30_06290, partial [Candidatus Omnitrophota bacterium]|nr:hypothetical protein [Candidatus Omnitrophota bacterium]